MNYSSSSSNDSDKESPAEREEGHHWGHHGGHHGGRHGGFGRRGSFGGRGHGCGFGGHKILKREIKIAVSVLCQGMKPFHQAVIMNLVKHQLKSEICSKGGDGEEPTSEELKMEHGPHGRGKHHGRGRHHGRGGHHGREDGEHHKRRSHSRGSHSRGSHSRGSHGSRSHSRGPHGRHKFFREMIKDGRFAEKIKFILNSILANKDKLVETIETIIGTLKNKKKEMFSQGEETDPEEQKREEGRMFPRMHQRFAKEVAMLIIQMKEKNIWKKEEIIDFADKLWQDIRKRRMKQMKRGAKMTIEKILSYKFDQSDSLYKSAVELAVTKAFLKNCRFEFAAHRKKFIEMKKKFEEEKKTDTKEKPCFGGPMGWKRFAMCGPMGWGRFGMGRGFGMGCGMGRGMRHGMGHGKRHGMGGPMKFENCMVKKGLEFVTNYLDTHGEDIKLCFEVAKVLVETYFNEIKECGLELEIAKKKALSHIVASAMLYVGDEKKPKEFYEDFAKKYLKGCVCSCGKECRIRCKELAEAGALLSGLKDEKGLRIAASWCTVMCCKANGKLGCPREVCADFIKKWMTDFLPIVNDALAVANEVKEEFKAEGKCPGKCHGKGMFMVKMLREYLQMNCSEGKLNKEELKGYLKERKARMNKQREEFMKKFEEKCKKCEEKK